MGQHPGSAHPIRWCTNPQKGISLSSWPRASFPDQSTLKSRKCSFTSVSLHKDTFCEQLLTRKMNEDLNLKHKCREWREKPKSSKEKGAVDAEVPESTGILLPRSRLVNTQQRNHAFKILHTGRCLGGGGGILIFQSLKKSYHQAAFLKKYVTNGQNQKAYEPGINEFNPKRDRGSSHTHGKKKKKGSSCVLELAEELAAQEEQGQGRNVTDIT